MRAAYFHHKQQLARAAPVAIQMRVASKPITAEQLVMLLADIVVESRGTPVSAAIYMVDFGSGGRCEWVFVMVDGRPRACSQS